jgi:hypothetical protein
MTRTTKTPGDQAGGLLLCPGCARHGGAAGEQTATNRAGLHRTTDPSTGPLTCVIADHTGLRHTHADWSGRLENR